MKNQTRMVLTLADNIIIASITYAFELFPNNVHTAIVLFPIKLLILFVSGVDDS